MIKAELSLRDVLSSLPADHPERAELEEEVQRFEERNALRKLAELQEAEAPERVLEVLETARQRYGDMYEAVAVPTVTLRETTRYPEGWVPLNPWFFQKLQEGRIKPETAATISEAWVLWDKTARPNYDGGRQLYGNGNDPLGEELAHLRSQGAVEVPSHTKHVPATSRFGLSANEVDGSFLPLHAQSLGLRADLGERAMTRPYALFNVIGNMRHPEAGQVNTWEWIDEKFGGGRRLLGGGSGGGGLGDVGGYWAGNRYDDVGFSPAIVLPPQA